MKNISILFFGLVIFLSSCASIQEPTIERIEDVDIIEMSKSKLDLNAFMVVNNPNAFALDLAKAELTVYVDDIELAKINQAFDTSMPANDNFKMPINIKMDLQKLYEANPIAALGKGLQIMSDRKLNVQFKGSIKVGKGAVKISVPVDQIELVKF